MPGGAADLLARMRGAPAPAKPSGASDLLAKMRGRALAPAEERPVGAPIVPTDSARSGPVGLLGQAAGEYWKSGIKPAVTEPVLAPIRQGFAEEQTAVQREGALEGAEANVATARTQRRAEQAAFDRGEWAPPEGLDDRQDAIARQWIEDYKAGRRADLPPGARPIAGPRMPPSLTEIPTLGNLPGNLSPALLAAARTKADLPAEVPAGRGERFLGNMAKLPNVALAAGTTPFNLAMAAPATAIRAARKEQGGQTSFPAVARAVEAPQVAFEAYQHGVAEPFGRGLERTLGGGEFTRGVGELAAMVAPFRVGEAALHGPEFEVSPRRAMWQTVNPLAAMVDKPIPLGPTDVQALMDRMPRPATGSVEPSPVPPPAPTQMFTPDLSRPLALPAPEAPPLALPLGSARNAEPVLIPPPPAQYEAPIGPEPPRPQPLAQQFAPSLGLKGRLKKAGMSLDEALAAFRGGDETALMVLRVRDLQELADLDRQLADVQSPSRKVIQRTIERGRGEPGAPREETVTAHAEAERRGVTPEEALRRNERAPTPPQPTATPPEPFRPFSGDVPVTGRAVQPTRFGTPPAEPPAAAPRTARRPVPDVIQQPESAPPPAPRRRFGKPQPFAPGERFAGGEPLPPIPSVDLLPPLAEGTVPLQRELDIRNEGVDANARRTGRVVVRQADGTEAIVPKDRAAEAEALAAQGKLAEIANGRGTSPKPPAIPPVAPGFVRLYRVESRPGTPSTAPEWVRQAARDSGAADATGRWFTDDPSELPFYRADNPDGHTVYIDVPQAEAESMRVSNLPGEGRGGHPARRFSARPHKEFFVTPEWAAKKQPYTEMVTARTPEGAEQRTVLTETPKATEAAVAEQKAQGLETEVKPATEQAMQRTLDERASDTLPQDALDEVRADQERQARAAYEADQAEENSPERRRESIRALPEDDVQRVVRRVEELSPYMPRAEAVRRAVDEAVGPEPPSNVVRGRFGARTDLSEAPESGPETSTGERTQPPASTGEQQAPTPFESAEQAVVSKISAPRPKFGAAAATRTPGPTPDTFYGSKGELRANVADLGVDPERFQHKEAPNARGVTGRLSKTKTWEEPTEPLSVWRDPADGKLYVVNGHQRIDLARRLGATDVPIQIIDAPDAAAARLEGAKENLRSGHATPADVARFFREQRVSPEKADEYLASIGVSDTAPGVREGRALAALPDAAWNEYRAGDIREARAVALGDAIRENELDDGQALELVDRAEKSKPRTKDDDLSILARRLKLAATSASGGPVGLFGEIAPPKSLLDLETRLQSGLLESFAEGKKRFGSMLKNAEAIEEQKVGTVDKPRATQIVETSRTLFDRARGFLSKKSRTPLDDMVSDAARDVDAGRLTEQAAAERLRKQAEEYLNADPFTRRRLDELRAQAPADEGGAGLFGAAEPKETRTSGSPPPLTEAPPESGQEQFRQQFGKPPKPPEEDPGTMGAGGGGIVDLPAAVRDAVDSIKQRIQFGPKKPKRFGQAAREAWQSFYNGWLRTEGAIGRLERGSTGTISDTGPTRTAQRAQGSAAGMAHEFYNEGNLSTYAATKPLRESLGEVRSATLADVAAYSVAKRVKTGYVPRDFAHGFAPKAVDAVVDYYEKTPAHADVVAAANAIHDHYDMLLKNLADAEGWSQERYERIRKANPFYVRFLRVVGEERDSPAIGGTGKPFPARRLKRVTGGEQPLRDPIPLVLGDTRAMIQAALQARTRRSILKTIEDNPEAAHAFVEQMSPRDLKDRFPQFDEIAAAMEDPARANDPELWASIHDAYEEALRGKVLLDFQGAQPKAFLIKDPLLADSLSGMSPVSDFLMRALPTRVAGAITGAQRAGITQLSPRFVLRNPVRDLQTFLRFTDAPVHRIPLRLAQGFTYSLLDQLHNYGLPVKESQWGHLYRRAGVEGFFDVEKNDVHVDLDWLAAHGLGAKIDYFRQHPAQILAKPANALLNIVRDANQIPEGAFRYAEMIETAQRRGATPDKFSNADLTAIAAKAGDVTLNFRLGGKYAKVANRYEAFLNARLQGLVRTGQEWRNRPLRMAGRTLMWSVLPKVALWAAIQNDKDAKAAYDRMPAWRKLLWNIPIGQHEDGSTRFLSLPSIPELDAPAILIESALNGLVAEDPAAAKDMAAQLAHSLNPVDDMKSGPSVIRPAVEVHQNRDEFTGRPVNPRGTEAQALEAPETVATPSTTPFAKAASSTLAKFGIKWTPPEIDHLIRGYAGSVGREVTSAQGMVESSDLPVVGSFFPRSSESRWVDDFYELKTRFEGQGEAFRSLIGRGEKGAEKYVGGEASVPEIGQIASALKALRDQSIAAKTEAERRGIAKNADELAKVGAQILKVLVDLKPAEAGK